MNAAETMYMMKKMNIYFQIIICLHEKYLLLLMINIEEDLKKVMSAVNMNHTSHETRHTFITQAKYCKVNEYILKKIVGHEIRDVTEAVYTHRNIEDLKKEIVKVKY